jgi:hypothetical protein
MGNLSNLTSGAVRAFQYSSTGEMELFNPEDGFDFVNDSVGG